MHYIRLNYITLHHIIIVLCLIAIFALTFAYISQYVFDLEPCALCLYQRKPFFAIIGICVFGLFLKSQRAQKIIIFLLLLLLIINTAIALYHAGVEQKIFRGPVTCSSLDVEYNSLEELQAALLAAKTVRCDQPSFVVLGISMAGWNAIYCLMVVMVIFFIYRYRIA
jgi:disulfide bond formation protein DsbB